jgi:hypothetical protein
MAEHKQLEIFFATSFSGHVDYDTGIVEEPFKYRIENILKSLREVGKFSVYCAVEAEDWKISQSAPGVSMATNYRNIEARPVFLALVDKVGSDGRGLEVAHAYDHGSAVYLATGPGEGLSWVMQEIVALGMAEHIAYEQPDELATTLLERLS